MYVNYNIDKNKVRNSVINNKFNTESTLYYLLVKKLKACGNDSVSDLCSNKFIKYIYEDNNKYDYLNDIQSNIELKIQNEITKGKENEKEKTKQKEKNGKKAISQLNDYMINLDKKDQIYNFNFNSRDNERDIDLSAVPGLINDYNFKKDNNNNNNYNYNNYNKFKYNLINNENNEYTLNNSVN